MSTEFQIASELLDPALPSYSAVHRCSDAWNNSFKSEAMKREPYGPALRGARMAYVKAMPPLIGFDNIRDYVACVAQGVVLGAISESQASRLLYAAQVAQGMIRHLPARKPSA
jgi:hypothetical protein